MLQDRVVLGSDYPFPLGEHHPGKLIEEVDFSPNLKVSLSPRCKTQCTEKRCIIFVVQEKLLSTNAAELFQLDLSKFN